jgi:hypothetical protein
MALLMKSDQFETPSVVAFAQFVERIEGDTALSAQIKKAVCEDLVAANPSSFERLKATLIAEANTHENQRAKSS